MFQWILRYFPIRVKSLVEFLKIVVEEKCDSVNMIPAIGRQDTVDTWTVGDIGTFYYVIAFESVTSKGRKVEFHLQTVQRWGSSTGFADSDKRAAIAIKNYLLAEVLYREMQRFYPQITINLHGPHGKGYMHESLFDELHRDALKLNVSLSPSEVESMQI
jgi:hypothetical protein